jgi:hypothetical protein
MPKYLIHFSYWPGDGHDDRTFRTAQVTVDSPICTKEDLDRAVQQGMKGVLTDRPLDDLTITPHSFSRFDD